MEFLSKSNEKTNEDPSIPYFFHKNSAKFRIEKIKLFHNLPSNRKEDLVANFNNCNTFTLQNYGSYHEMTRHRYHSIHDKLDFIPIALNYDFDSSPRSEFIESVYNIRCELDQNGEYKRRINFILCENNSLEIYIFNTNVPVSPDTFVKKYIAGLILTKIDLLVDIFGVLDMYVLIFKKIDDYEYDLSFVYSSLTDMSRHYDFKSLSLHII